MIFSLKHFDTELLRFSATMDTALPEIGLLWADARYQHLLPLDLEVTPDGISTWIKARNIPRNRAFMQEFLSKQGLHPNRPLDIILVSKGLCLTDCYWIVPETDTDTFLESNLFDNHFSEILSQIAFTGFGSKVRTSLGSSPEFGTNGMLPKCWRRFDDKIFLWKSGTSGFSNTGFEPYSEFFASQIAKELGLHSISYDLQKWKGQLCSTCELFTTKDVSFMPIGNLVPRGGLSGVFDFYERLGKEFTQSLQDMLVFDAIICNEDRHFGNFGVLVDNATNRIIAPAPLFDHGTSLWNFAGQSDLANRTSFREYAEERLPFEGRNFYQNAKENLRPEMRSRLISLLKLQLVQHDTYKIPDVRFSLMTEQLHLCIKNILENS